MIIDQKVRAIPLAIWRKAVLVTVAMIGFSALSVSDIPVVGSGEAEAIVGRPATPYSVAGVARRTVRRNY